MTSKSEITYSKLFSKLVELEQGLNPTRIMVDFEEAAINALEDILISVISGCFFHLSQKSTDKFNRKTLQLTIWKMKNSQFK